ncbi:MAG: hypothetical protein MI864_07310 [Pseudomonadales bacterium]|uniref:Uncharacterized protein n=1 Tax=Oleiphilus messinensis TaxID=141451 RepID=A0A1Y0I551_9GAMM|nr:hypothetical protein [Oleiphilus messinensis]ARU54574.1 hypothetical protein OLMES_0470 [Oleiphilus messinensis]MCG8610328.1 hypothetical protein [Pseudomonadales bacterium]
MFYRFTSKLATQERLEAFPVPVPGTDKFDDVPWIDVYEAKFNLLQQHPSIVGVKLFQAPLYDTKKPRGLCLRFHQGKESAWLPDIWGVANKLIVSEKCKAVIEAMDEMEHEYLPIEWIDWQEKPVKTEQPYYWFNQRRYLKIEPTDRLAQPPELGFCPIPGEEDFLARILDTHNLREHVERFPIWQHYGLEGPVCRQSQARAVVYMSQKLINALREKEVRGMDIYSEKYGKGEEALCGL